MNLTWTGHRKFEKLEEDGEERRINEMVNNLNKMAAYSEAHVCLVVIFTVKRPILNAKFTYVYIHTGVATVLKFCTYIYIRKYERVL